MSDPANLKLTSPGVPSDLVGGASRWDRGWLTWVLPWVVGLVGLLVSLNGVLREPLNTLFPGFSDSRLNMYLLENCWLWVTGGDQGLWQPGIFYPEVSTVFQRNLLLGFSPPYMVCRALGLAPPQALTGFILIISALNYAAAYWFLRRAIRVSMLASCLGAWIIAYGCAHFVRIYHLQLIPQFYVLGMLGAVCCYFRALEDGAVTAGRRRFWIGLFCLCLVGQWYSEFYMWFFTLFVLGIAGFWNGVMHVGRQRMLRAVTRDWLFLLLAAGLTGALVWPLVQGPIPAWQQTDALQMRAGGDILGMAPRPRSWIFMTEYSVFYGWMYKLSFFSEKVFAAEYRHEHTIGFGLLTMSLGVIGLLVNVRRRGAILLLFCILTVLYLTTYTSLYALPWERVFRWVPGASGVRVVARIGLLLPIAGAIGLAMLIDRARSKVGLAMMLFLGLLCCTEQLVKPPFVPVNENELWPGHLAKLVDPTKKAFMVTIQGRPPVSKEALHIDAMLASQMTGVPTINGYDFVGKFPPGWFEYLWETDTSTPEHRDRFESGFKWWLDHYQLDPKEIQWIDLPASYRHVSPFGYRP